MNRADSFLGIAQGISAYHGGKQAQAWLERYQGLAWQLAIALAFTETALIPGISAAGKTPGDRQFTAHADAEFLYNGLQAASSSAQSHPLPPLTAGLSPVLISRALLEATGSPARLINAGLSHPLESPHLDLGLPAARCLSTGTAMPRPQVQHSFERGLQLGETWPTPAVPRFTTASKPSSPLPAPSYAVLGECVVGGTTTALGLLMGLGVDALGRVNSSHGQCNHNQKAKLVAQGLAASGLGNAKTRRQADPLDIVAAMGDPMQPFIAGYAIALSRHHGVLLAGGTQMLAVYALATAMAQHYQLDWKPENIAIGTTRWVAADPTGDTAGLANAIEQRFGQAPILFATDLSFSESRHPGLRAYEQGFVKEGVGAGGCAIATALSLGWSEKEIGEAIEIFVTRYSQWRVGMAS